MTLVTRESIHSEEPGEDSDPEVPNGWREIQSEKQDKSTLCK